MYANSPSLDVKMRAPTSFMTLCILLTAGLVAAVVDRELLGAAQKEQQEQTDKNEEVLEQQIKWCFEPDIGIIPCNPASAAGAPRSKA